MSITCQICQKTFEKIIPWQHLKSHGVESKDYKESYGPVISDSTRAKMAGKEAHNKGKKVTSAVALQNIATAVAKREIRFQNGEFSRGTTRSEAQRADISKKQSQYAAANKEKMKERTQKALRTKREKNYDFGSVMRGKTQSDHAKLTASKTRTRLNQELSQKTNVIMLSRMEALGLTLINDINNTELHLSCRHCGTDFSLTKQYFQPAKYKETICPTCHPRTSNTSAKELAMLSFIQTIWPTAMGSYRPDGYHSKEIDVFIPEKKIGFEFNGLYYHSELVKVSNNQSKTSDYDKLILMRDKGIRLIQIFEDEWDTKRDIVYSRIRNILGLTDTVIYARKCTIKEVTSKTASDFCSEHHIMGKGRSNVRLGLYYHEELVSLMTFVNSNLSRKSSSWEINRFASKINTTVVGGASRLFKSFVNQNDPNRVISYSDNRWSDGGLYETLGFVKESDGVPNYWYIKANFPLRIHRFSLRKNANDDQSKTEYELRTDEGYLRIWDSGSARWVLEKPAN